MGAEMQTAEKIINTVKDAYLWLAQKVSDHPHIVIVVAAVYLLVRR
jgi:hypothetical protein